MLGFEEMLIEGLQNPAIIGVAAFVGVIAWVIYSCFGE